MTFQQVDGILGSNAVSPQYKPPASARSLFDNREVHLVSLEKTEDGEVPDD